MKTIDFFYFFGSVYAYLSVMRIGRLADAAGLTVRWRPFNVRTLMEENNVAMRTEALKIPGVIAVVPGSLTMLDRVTMASITVLLDDQDKRAPILDMGKAIRGEFKDFPSARPRGEIAEDHNRDVA